MGDGLYAKYYIGYANSRGGLHSVGHFIRILMKIIPVYKINLFAYNGRYQTQCLKSFIAISLYPFTAPLVIPLIICSWKRT